MESENIEEKDEGQDTGDGTPVCIKCFQPVDPLSHYCPNCGQACGQFTQYIPFVNIQWQADVWGQMWRQLWYRDISIAGRLGRFLMIIWCVPILLVGLLFKINFRGEKHDDESEEEQD